MEHHGPQGRQEDGGLSYKPTTWRTSERRDDGLRFYFHGNVKSSGTTTVDVKQDVIKNDPEDNDRERDTTKNTGNNKNKW